MRIIGWPEEPDEEGSILPLTIVDVDFHGSPEELRAIGRFLLNAANELDIAQARNLPMVASIDLANSNPVAKVGVSVNAVRHVEN